MSRKLTEGEKNLWRSITRAIEPLHPQQAIKAAEKRQLAREKKIKQAPDKPKNMLPLFTRKAIPAQDVDARTLLRLRRGQMDIDATIDLHGHSVKEAEFVLKAFLQDCYKAQARYVLVIHGKGSITGEAKIKKELPRWFGDLPEIILAHAPAKPMHGGLGASYVLLRRKRMT